MKRKDPRAMWYGRQTEKLSFFLYKPYIHYAKFGVEKPNLAGSWQPNSVIACRWNGWLVLIGRLRRRGGFKLHTLGNSLQKLRLTGTAASWMWRCFTWPALPLTAGGVLDKQHQEAASKTQKKHSWKNYVGIWSTCFPDSSTPKRNTDYFSSKVISSWGKIPNIKKLHSSYAWSKGLELL